MIVCLMGPSAAGKSTLAKVLAARDPQHFARVPVDFFFLPGAFGVTLSQHLASPFAYDWDAIDRALARCGSGRSTPDWDFEQFTWRADSGGIPIGEAPTYLLDGMRPHPRCDFLVMLDLDPAEQRRRLVERDLRWETQVADREAHLAATFDAGCAELTREPDLRLTASATPEANATRVFRALTTRRFEGS